MATIYIRKNAAGERRYLARAAVRQYRPVSRTFQTRKDAVEWAEAEEAKLLAAKKSTGTSHDVSAYTIGHLIRDFLAEPKVQKQRSLDDTKRRLAWWVDKYGDVRVLDVRAQLLRRARTALGADPECERGPATVNRHLSCMRAAWNFGLNAELIVPFKPWPKALMLPEPGGRVRFLSGKEITALLKAAEADPVMKTAITMSIGCGLRQGELLRLTWADIDLGKQQLTVHLSKTGKRRGGHIPAHAVDALKALKKLPVVSATHVFLNQDSKPMKKSLLETRWRVVRTAAKLADFRWHDLRHTCASQLAQNGASLLEIGSVLGHSSPGMTQRYSHLVAGAPVTGHDKVNVLLGGKEVKHPAS